MTSTGHGSRVPRVTPVGMGRGVLACAAFAGSRWVVALIVVLVTGALWGVQTVPMSLDELAAQADLILSGRVVGKTCLRDEAGRICSKVELDVRETWKGRVPSGRFTITLGGGTLGDRRVVVPGQADYVPGEEVVVFLRLNPRGEGVTLGLAQGKFAVRIEEQTGERVLHNLFLGGSGAPRSPVGLQAVGANAGRLLLQDVKRRVQGGVP